MEQGCGMNSFPVTRRAFVQANAGAMISSVAPLSMASTASRPMNVLLVMSDQMRGDALGCAGNPNAFTPHLDRLAEGSCIFSHSFCNSPVCVPSRMAMFSGRYPHQTGRTSNLPWDGPLLDVDDTLGGYFQQRGYRCGWIGKNHTYKSTQLREVFSPSSVRGREPFRTYSRFVPPHWHSHTLWPEEHCHPQINTNEAIAFMNEATPEQPFFLNINYFDPHPPYMAPDRYIERSRNREMHLPDTPAPSELHSRLQDFADGFRMQDVTDEGLQETLRYYHASVEWGVDAQVGRLMQALEEQGLQENTIVVFTSDHGDFMGDYRLVRKGMFLYDALLHVPLLIHVPGLQATECSELTQAIDLFPTLVELTGGTPPQRLMGNSLLPCLEGRSLDREEALFTTSAYGQVAPVVDPSRFPDGDDTPLHTRVMRQSMNPQFETRMIRTKDYKLIVNDGDSEELYALDGGVGEQRNLAGAEESKDIQQQLRTRLDEWRAAFSQE